MRNILHLHSATAVLWAELENADGIALWQLRSRLAAGGASALHRLAQPKTNALLSLTTTHKHVSCREDVWGGPDFIDCT